MKHAQNGAYILQGADMYKGGGGGYQPVFYF
jgi:hypothetical protein